MAVLPRVRDLRPKGRDHWPLRAALATSFARAVAVELAHLSSFVVPCHPPVAIALPIWQCQCVYSHGTIPYICIASAATIVTAGIYSVTLTGAIKNSGGGAEALEEIPIRIPPRLVPGLPRNEPMPTEPANMPRCIY